MTFLYVNKYLSIYIRVQACFNPLNPQVAIKHHFASLKNDLISPKLRGFRMPFFLELFQ